MSLVRDFRTCSGVIDLHTVEILLLRVEWLPRALMLSNSGQWCLQCWCQEGKVKFELDEYDVNITKNVPDNSI